MIVDVVGLFLVGRFGGLLGVLMNCRCVLVVWLFLVLWFVVLFCLFCGVVLLFVCNLDCVFVCGGWV